MRALRYSRGEDWQELRRRVEAVQDDLKKSATGQGAPVAGLDGLPDCLARFGLVEKTSVSPVTVWAIQ